ncbi:RNA polymerase subunit sigma-70 [Lutibacter profundi]|uniref:RNA polymerase subunit sigma-70 n=1 Tax=Lutibacter profundi TaxID=1622118 RepID=A0A109RP10_9FLAO|nr:RNA polymerase sigma-70 factor [Lutibacter profundi]AMC11754.1 RNA polymerase subunit sigma-70 [Lutibacter profundi]
MIRDINNICNPVIFEKVFRTYSKDLKRFLYFKFGDMESCEDILQDTFVKLWDNCSSVNYNKVKSYLFTIGNNLFLNIKKHEKIVREHQQIKVNESTHESPEFLLLEQEFQLKLEKAINALSEKQREVFLLNKIEKKKYKEIAEMLGLSVKAVEKRMHGALKALRDKIGNI